ncbi:MAG: hypothetical protein GEU93_06130 [Propionibacteriales bacterium]|nr:hypothetical protein [Propionibacteriales bacterium]
MTATSTRFEGQLAPCGRKVDGERSQSEDLQGLITQEFAYDCGCRSGREEYHDGSVHHLIVHHNGKILVDEEFRGE